MSLFLISRHCLFFRFLKQSTFSHLKFLNRLYVKNSWEGENAKERCDTDVKKHGCQSSGVRHVVSIFAIK